MTYWNTVVLNLSHKVTYISNYDQKQLRPARVLNLKPRTHPQLLEHSPFWEADSWSSK